jgi:hypothetical protein
MLQPVGVSACKDQPPQTSQAAEKVDLEQNLEALALLAVRAYCTYSRRTAKSGCPTLLFPRLKSLRHEKVRSHAYWFDR